MHRAHVALFEQGAWGHARRTADRLSVAVWKNSWNDDPSITCTCGLISGKLKSPSENLTWECRRRRQCHHGAIMRGVTWGGRSESMFPSCRMTGTRTQSSFLLAAVLSFSGNDGVLKAYHVNIETAISIRICKHVDRLRFPVMRHAGWRCGEKAGTLARAQNRRRVPGSRTWARAQTAG